MNSVTDIAALRRPNHYRRNAINFVRFKDEPAPREWIVEGLIPSRQVTLLGGDGGLGKSLLALQLQFACSAGMDWLGRRTEPCRSIGLYCEDEADELHRRMRDIWQASGLPFDHPGPSYAECISGVGAENALVSFESMTERGDFSGESIRKTRWRETEAWQDILDWALESEARLVILDSLHDLVTGNENARAEVRFFVGRLRHIACEIDGAVVVPMHPSLTGLSSGSGMSGSTAWNNAVRSRLYLTRPKGGDEDAADDTRRVLKTMKSNHGPAGGRIPLVWEAGVFKPEVQATGMVAAIERRNRDNGVIEAIRDSKVPLSMHNNAANYAPKMLVASPHCRGMKRNEIESALIRLAQSGAIAYGEVKRGADRHLIRSYYVPGTGDE